ncbi:MAG: phosphate acyltransferase PlsX [Firmicutes bacterium]|nr:phosphate acyltransferase PlsX [Bacillota bacterium]
MNIILDAHGGDLGPAEIIKGAATALKNHNDLHIVLAGRQAELEAIIAAEKIPAGRTTIIPAETVISCNEAPVEAIRTRKDSSMVVALDYLKQNENCVGLISAGSTGAILTGAFLKLGRLKGISRPVLAPVMPTVKKGWVLLLDCGANMDSTPDVLLQSAIMGSEYMKKLYGIESPRVALLNVGTEEAKGNELVKATYQLLKKQSNINFVGNMEAYDTLSGEFDVVVTDGFAGNVLLKGVEGSVMSFMRIMKREIKASFMAKIGYKLFMGKAFKAIRASMDREAFGYSPFLGVKKYVLKTHGSCTAKSVAAAIDNLIKMENSKLLENFERGLN